MRAGTLGPVLGVAAALSIPLAAHGAAPVCPNPPPALASAGSLRDARVTQTVRRIVAAVEEDRRRSRVASLAIGIVHDQTVLAAAGLGCANLERGLPATPDTVYRIGTITKVFEATALMQLRDAGRLRLDEAVDRYVPEAWYPGPNGLPASARTTSPSRCSRTATIAAPAATPSWRRRCTGCRTSTSAPSRTIFPACSSVASGLDLSSPSAVAR